MHTRTCLYAVARPSLLHQSTHLNTHIHTRIHTYMRPVRSASPSITVRIWIRTHACTHVQACMQQPVFPPSIKAHAHAQCWLQPSFINFNIRVPHAVASACLAVYHSFGCVFIMSVCVCVCVCVCLCVCACTYTHVCIHANTHTYQKTYKHTMCAPVYTFASPDAVASTCLDVYQSALVAITHIHMNIHTHRPYIYIYIYMLIHALTHVHTCTKNNTFIHAHRTNIDSWTP